MITKKKFIEDIHQGDQIEDQFIVIESRQDQAKNGPYWQLTLQDKTGSIPARIWSPLSQNFSRIDPEQVVLIRATANSFRDQLQLNIDQLEFVAPEQSDLSLFLPVSEIPPDVLFRQLMDYLHQNVIFPPWKKFYKSILNNKDIQAALIKAPGGKSIHHAYIGGLLEHTLGVCKICSAMTEIYPRLDRDILLVGAALHDLGKAVEISAGVSRDYTDQGKLVGHIILGLEMMTPFMVRAKNLSDELLLHFKHIIISHHGELEFGSPKRPKTREAMVLHFADNMDAKLNTMDLAFKDHEQEPSWSPFHRTLGRFLYNPAKTPLPEI